MGFGHLDLEPQRLSLLKVKPSLRNLIFKCSHVWSCLGPTIAAGFVWFGSLGIQQNLCTCSLTHCRLSQLSYTFSSSSFLSHSFSFQLHSSSFLSHYLSLSFTLIQNSPPLQTSNQTHPPYFHILMSGKVSQSL